MAIAMALSPTGVLLLGVIEGVMEGVKPLGVEPPGVAFPGVILGVIPGVILGVNPPPPGVAPGVSSHLDFLLLAPGVGVSCMRSPPLSVLGVSAHPLPWPGVSEINKI